MFGRIQFLTTIVAVLCMTGAGCRGNGKTFIGSWHSTTSYSNPSEVWGVLRGGRILTDLTLSADGSGSRVTVVMGGTDAGVDVGHKTRTFKWTQQQANDGAYLIWNCQDGDTLRFKWMPSDDGDSLTLTSDDPVEKPITYTRVKAGSVRTHTNDPSVQG